MKLVFCADMAVTGANEALFIKGDVETVTDKGILDYLRSFDYRIINVEMALTDTNEPIVKCGPNIKASKAAIKGVKAFDPSLALLSNNHVLDFGEAGFNDTMDVLRASKIPFIGGGKNLAEAKIPYIFEKDGKKVGIYNCGEHEFTIATETSGGANPYDPLESFDHISDLKSKCDYVVVIYHGGKEHYRYPSPEVQKRCRKMIDKGADAVICQHSHCIGCFEDYKCGKIIYGQGNFVFVENLNEEAWKTSLIVGVTVEDGLSFEYYPICMSEVGARSATKEESEEILGNFFKRSEEIKTPGVIGQKYADFAATMIEGYLRKMQRVYNKDDGYDMEMITAMYNYFTCEAHLEVVAEGLKNIFRNEKPYWNYKDGEIAFKL
ncbi:MAG: CapA family protein [Oscillospiraceae bacterium]|nr:CapA family protein [Oscillospiraceae bacterium]